MRISIVNDGVHGNDILLEVNGLAFPGNGNFDLANTAGTKYRITVAIHDAVNAGGSF